MPIWGQIAAGVAGALHVVFFLFEAVLFKRPSIQKRFFIPPSAAEAVRPWALNQGFYNLFLALGLFAGLALKKDPYVIFPCACMVAAGFVLIATDLRMLRSGVIQLVPPAIALASLVV